MSIGLATNIGIEDFKVFFLAQRLVDRSIRLAEELGPDRVVCRAEIARVRTGSMDFARALRAEGKRKGHVLRKR